MNHWYSILPDFLTTGWFIFLKSTEILHYFFKWKNICIFKFRKDVWGSWHHHATCINYRFHETQYLPIGTVVKMCIWSPGVPYMWYNEVVLHEYTSRKHWADVSSSDQRPQTVMSRSLHLKRPTLRLRVSRGSTQCWLRKNYRGNVSWAMDSLTILEAMRSNP